MRVLYRNLKKLICNGNYSLIHCHEPVGSVLARLAACGNGAKVIYTAHGFHFYKGASWVNWIAFFLVEWLCSYLTDVLITINQEDHAFAQQHMHAKRIHYIHGIGVNLQKFNSSAMTDKERNVMRVSLGVGENDRMLLSVGELIPRKNHEVIIKALSKINDRRLKYFVAGSGELKQYLDDLAHQLGLENQIFFLGFRKDIAQLCACCDLYILPSKQEGLSVALLEAIACKALVICSDIRGNKDLINQSELFDIQNINDVVNKIIKYSSGNWSNLLDENNEKMKQYCLNSVLDEMKYIYCEMENIK